MKTIKVLIPVFLLFCSACSTQATMFGGSDFQMSGTEAGWKAYGDHVSAVITNSKASADVQDTPAYELRRKQEVEKTTRKLGWGWNGKKVSTGSGSTSGAVATPASRLPKAELPHGS